MKKLLIIITLTMSSNLQAQPTTVKEAWSEKWENSKVYLLEMARSMPEEQYSFKPTERQMSFAEQLVHIQSNMQWLGSTHFEMKETAKATADDDKETIINKLEQSFDAVGAAVKVFPEEGLADTVDFFAGPKSKLQLLNLLQDHLTHHRGQLIVYLNLNQIEPPRYSGW